MNEISKSESLDSLNLEALTEVRWHVRYGLVVLDKRVKETKEISAA